MQVEEINEYLENYNKLPQTYLAMQAEGREWIDMFSKETINKFDYVNVVEGYTDVHMMNLAGAKNTIACCGTAITPDHIKLLKKYSKTVNLMLDGDNAGVHASITAGKGFFSLGCHVSINPLQY